MKKTDQTQWQGSTPPSLIQQRSEIDRLRLRGLLGIWGGLILAALFVAQLARSGFDVLHLLQAVLAGIFVYTGARTVARYRRRIAAFEAEHGRDAGRQHPIR